MKSPQSRIPSIVYPNERINYHCPPWIALTHVQFIIHQSANGTRSFFHIQSALTPAELAQLEQRHCIKRWSHPGRIVISNSLSMIWWTALWSALLRCWHTHHSSALCMCLGPEYHQINLIKKPTSTIESLQDSWNGPHDLVNACLWGTSEIGSDVLSIVPNQDKDSVPNSRLQNGKYCLCLVINNTAA